MILTISIPHAVVRQPVGPVGGYVCEHLTKSFFHHRPKRQSGPLRMSFRSRKQLILDVNRGFHLYP